MSLTPEQLEDLMAYADGEPLGEAHDRTQRLVAESEDAREVLASLGVLGSWVRQDHAERVAPIAIDVADAVMAKIGAPAHVVAFAEADRAHARARRFARNGAVGAAFASVALAAGVILYLRSAEMQTVIPGARLAQTAHGIEQPSAPSSGASPAEGEVVAAGELPGSGVEVNQLDTASHETSVFYLPAATGANANASSIVVWITEDAKKAPGER